MVPTRSAHLPQGPGWQSPRDLQSSLQPSLAYTEGGDAPANALLKRNQRKLLFPLCPWFTPSLTDLALTRTLGRKSLRSVGSQTNSMTAQPQHGLFPEQLLPCPPPPRRPWWLSGPALACLQVQLLWASSVWWWRYSVNNCLPESPSWGVAEGMTPCSSPLRNMKLDPNNWPCGRLPG